jgi:peptide/nickel transport system ATP-binding protein
VPDPGAPRESIRLAGDVPSPIDLPGGCRFHTRCPRFLGEICASQEPPWQAADGDHAIRCHIPLADLAQAQRSLFTAD